MKPDVTHFGPLRIHEFVDGYVVVEEVACGRMYVNENTLEPACAHRLTIDPARVTCQNCLAAISKKHLTAPQIYRDPGVSPFIAADPTRYNLNQINLIRHVIGLPAIILTEATRELHKQALRKSIGCSERLIAQGQTELDDVAKYRDKWPKLAVPRLTDITAPVRSSEHVPATSTGPIHLWPAQVTEYADGYTCASMTACGLFSETYNSESEKFSAANITSNPALVTCVNCLNTKVLTDAKREPMRFVELVIRRVPRMRSAVVKNPELYDFDRNNAIRQIIGLSEVDRNVQTTDLVEAELEKLQYYAQNRMEVGTREKARKLNLLAHCEGNPPRASAPPSQNQNLLLQPEVLDQGIPTREETLKNAGSVSAWLWLLTGILALVLLGLLLH